MRIRREVQADERTERELLAQIAEDVRDVRKFLSTVWVLFWIAVAVVVLAALASASGS